MSLGVCSGQAWGSKSTPGLAKASRGPELQPQDNLSGRKGARTPTTRPHSGRMEFLERKGLQGLPAGSGTPPLGVGARESGEVCRRKLLALTGQLGTLHTQLPHHWATRA